MNENEVSCIKWARQVQFPEESRQTGVNVIGVIVALIQTIPSVLNIFDPTRFPIPISYFFFTIAVTVVANSGKLVHAAIIVAPIARCDIQKISAIYTAESTTTSDDKTKSHKLAINFPIFSSIHFDHFFFHTISDKMNSTIKIQQKIPLNVHIQNDMSKVAGSDHTVIFSTESAIIQTNK